MKRSLLIAALFWATSLSVGAMAAEPSADALIEQGLGLRREGKPEQALELFRQAHAIAPSPRTFGQMGLVETSLKRWVDGENHLSLSLANPDDRWVAKNRAFLDEALGSCRRHVGDLVVSGPAGAEVFVAGQSVGTLPAVPALRLAEGTVTVSASAPGSKPFERTVTIRPGARSTLVIALAPDRRNARCTASCDTCRSRVTAPAPAPLIALAPPTHGESSPSNWHTWAGVSLAVAGAAALGWGIVLDRHRRPHERPSTSVRHPNARADHRRGWRGRPCRGRGDLFHRPTLDRFDDRRRAHAELGPVAR